MRGQSITIHRHGLPRILAACAWGLLALLTACGGPAPTFQEITNSTGLLSFGGGFTPLALAADPRTPGVVYVGTSEGVFRTTANTTVVFINSAGIPAHTGVHAFMPQGQTVYAGTDKGVFASADGGEVWTAQSEGLPENAGVIALATSPDAALLFASVSQHGIFLSTDHAAHWQAVSGLPGAIHATALLWLDADHTLYAGLAGQGLVLSRDNGQHWAPSASGLPHDATIASLAALTEGGLASSGPTLYAATSAGLFASVDSGQSWKVTGNLPGGSVGTVVAVGANRLDAGVANAVYQSVDGGRAWMRIADRLTGAVVGVAEAPDRAHTQVIFAASARLYRYPAQSDPNSRFAYIGIVIIALLLALLYLRYRRTHRRARSQPTGGAPISAPPTPVDTRSPAERYGDADTWNTPSLN